MLTTLAVSLGFVALAALCWPNAAWQQIVLGLMGRLLRMGLVAGLVAGYVFYLQPAAVPPEMAEVLPSMQGPEWLLLAAALVLTLLPVLATVDFAQRLAGHRRLMGHLADFLGEWSHHLTQEWNESLASGMSSENHRTELRRALDSMTQVTNARSQPANKAGGRCKVSELI